MCAIFEYTQGQSISLSASALLTKIDRLGLSNHEINSFPLPLFQLICYQPKWQSRMNYRCTSSIYTLLLKIYFTNRTGEDVTLMMPTHDTDTDPLVVPTGLSCLCFCRDDIVPDYFTMFIEIYATDPQTILDIVGRTEPCGSVIYVHIKLSLDHQLYEIHLSLLSASTYQHILSYLSLSSPPTVSLKISSKKFATQLETLGQNH
jgi:hypothetical protein